MQGYYDGYDHSYVPKLAIGLQYNSITGLNEGVDVDVGDVAHRARQRQPRVVGQVELGTHVHLDGEVVLAGILAEGGLALVLSAGGSARG